VVVQRLEMQELQRVEVVIRRSWLEDLIQNPDSQMDQLSLQTTDLQELAAEQP